MPFAAGRIRCAGPPSPNGGAGAAQAPAAPACRRRRRAVAESGRQVADRLAVVVGASRTRDGLAAERQQRPPR